MRMEGKGGFACQSEDRGCLKIFESLKFLKFEPEKSSLQPCTEFVHPCSKISGASAGHGNVLLWPHSA